MEKKNFFVTVHTGEILEGHAADYDFEVEATDEEIDELQYLFEKAHQAEGDTFLHAMTPYIPYHDDKPNDDYDQALKEIYRTIHQLGTFKTRQHIESMGILDSLR